ncbi:MAG: hypothetical protein HY301_14055 [Verrucomicrobia bacterium]|nr:hypothetical protein [Verrucomicrobiota bacterium]
MKGTRLLNSLRLAGWVAALGFLPAAGAATLVVTNLADDGPGTLRQAITNAASGDLITFATHGTITLTNGELFITNNLTLLGPGATNLAISGNQASRVFNVGSNTSVGISELTVRDGKAANNYYANYSPASPGGGIFNQGALALTNCSVTANTAGYGVSPIYPVLSLPGGHGGGIYSTGPLSLMGCTLSSNRAGDGGGAGAAGGNGGAIFSSGPLFMTSCTIYGNHAGNNIGNPPLSIHRAAAEGGFIAPPASVSLGARSVGTFVAVQAVEMAAASTTREAVLWLWSETPSLP